MSLNQLNKEALSRKSVIVFCKDASAVVGLEQSLKEKNFSVKIETNVSSLFRAIDAEVPGMVLVSRSADSAMKQHLPDYLKKKYKIAVITFSEESTSASQDSSNLFIQGNSLIHLQTQDQKKISDQAVNFQKDLAARDETATFKHKKSLEKVWGKLGTKVKEKSVFQQSDNLWIESIRIESSAGDSHLTLALPLGSEFAPHRQVVRDWLTKELKSNFGEQAIIQFQQMQLTTSYFRKIAENSGHKIEGHFESTEAVFCMFEELSDEDASEWMDAMGAFVVPLEKWMTRIQLEFPVYLWLESNGKKVMYARQGSPLTEEQFARLKAKGVSSVLLQPEDMHAYHHSRVVSYVQPGYAERPWEDAA